MSIHVLGLSHKTAPVEVREQLAANDTQLEPVMGELRALDGVLGVFATATCNRFEVYLSAAQAERAVTCVRDWLHARHRGLDPGAVSRAIYHYADEEAVRHLFRVASSLDSMVVGEPQILGQVKEAFETAVAIGATDRLLHRSVSSALRVAKKVRSETGIGRQAVSVPQVSVQLARKIFGDLRGRRALLIGAGEMNTLAARALTTHGVGRIDVVNRSIERARVLAAELDGHAHGLDALETLLGEVDIVISSTAAPDPVVRTEMVRRAFTRRRYQPLFLIDIAVPRDIEESVGELPNVYLFDVDDLQEVAEANRGARDREAREAESIVATEAHRFFVSLEGDRVTPTLIGLRERFGVMKDEELARALKGVDDAATRQRLERLANGLVNRLLHGPLTELKRIARDGDPEEAVALVEALFGLHDHHDD
jgi:glutamyl-tRNA reductase